MFHFTKLENAGVTPWVKIQSEVFANDRVLILFSAREGFPVRSNVGTSSKITETSTVSMQAIDMQATNGNAAGP